MNIFTNIDNLKIQNPIVTVGTFDGVHLGHQKLLNELISEAKNSNGSSTVFTFGIHPRKVLFPNQKLELLHSVDEKKYFLEKLELENLILFNFTKEFSELSAYDFIEKILVKKLNIKKLIFGFNHQFGKDRIGNFENVKNCAKKFGFEIKKISPHVENEITISSTLIRKSLQNGNIPLAKKYLGYNYLISGKVEEGNQIGRMLGFPTANISIPKDKLLPKYGVYVVNIEIDSNIYAGMLNLGSKPTVNQDINKKNIEVHIFNFDGNIYNKHIRIFFISRLRDEMKFNSLDELQKQLEIDKQKALSILKVKQINN